MGEQQDQRSMGDRRVRGRWLLVLAMVVLPIAAYADLSSAIAETLARTQAAAAELRARLSLTLAGSLGQAEAAVVAAVNRSDQSLSQIIQQAGGDYVTPTPGTVTDPPAYIQSGGMMRRYIAIHPITVTPGAPVLFLLHAHGLSPETMANLTRAGRLAADYGAWVFLPEGVNKDWNSDPSNIHGADDVSFLDQLISVAIDDHQLDGHHLYFAGYSGGGFMSERMACERGDRIAGIGMVAATLRSAEVGLCAPTHAMAVSEMNGTSDVVVLYKGLFANYSGYYGAPETAAFWAIKNGCDPTATQTSTLPNQEKVPSNTVVQLSNFTQCPAGTGVQLYTIDNGGHTWPGSQDAGFTVALGRTSGDVDATIALWTFLIGYSLP